MIGYSPEVRSGVDRWTGHGKSRTAEYAQKKSAVLIEKISVSGTVTTVQSNLIKGRIAYLSLLVTANEFVRS